MFYSVFAMETEFTTANESELLCPCGQVAGKRIRWLIKNKVQFRKLLCIKLNSVMRQENSGGTCFKRVVGNVGGGAWG